MEILDESGLPLTTYRHRGRTYLLGHAGQRYIVRITNPTPRRIEAVLSVDGLDAVDGEAADVRKRGYVIPPYGDVRIEGFRVSTAHVASFRFSSVGNSYAGRKGKARNVGVIGVAIFEEEGPPELALGHVTPHPRPYYREEYRRHRSRSRGVPSARQDDLDMEPGAEASAEPAAPPADRSSAAEAGSARPSRRAPSSAAQGMGGATADAECCWPQPQPSARPGLGTEFGEQRYSAVSWTPFVRIHPVRPSTVLELRYNDAPGLQALGIPVMYHDEVLTRETATPFPGDPHFARAPY